ncbi:efflux RND transporter periplasmic adaptor subunit [bacterium]
MKTKRQYLIPGMIIFSTIIIFIILNNIKSNSLQTANIKSNKNIHSAKHDNYPASDSKYVRIFKAKKVDFRDSIRDLIGTVTGANFEIKSSQEETVTNIYYQTGDFVNKGTVLIELDHIRTRAVLEKAKLEYAKIKQLYEAGGAGKFRLQEAIQDLRIAQKDYDETFVKAFSNGFVGRIFIKEGEYVYKQTPIMDFIDNTKPSYIKVKIIEKKLPLVRVGSKALIYIRFLDKNVEAFVSSISPIVSPLNRMADVMIKVPYEYKKYLKPGFSADVSIDIYENQSIMIPISCLIEGKKSVYIIENKFLKERELQTGYKTREYIEIIDGLTDGELLVMDISNSNVSVGDEVVYGKPNEYESDK